MSARAALLFLAAWASIGAWAQYPPLKSKVEAIEVTPRVFYVQGEPGVASAANEGFNSNAGFVATERGIVVIDALGTPALGAALVRAIRTVSHDRITRVIVTHYHADHFYGLEPLKKAGAEIWAHRDGAIALNDGQSQRRLEQRSRDLFPWVDEKMPLIAADRWLDGDTTFTINGMRFDLIHMGPAHSPEDLVVALPGEGVIFTGDILFAGRVPFVGEADSKRWIERIDRLLAMKPQVMIPGHGEVSRDPRKDLGTTREYLVHLREVMGKAVADFVPFEEAYARADWSRFAKLPAFEAANRINAYGQYLVMERELLGK
ncbi:MAG TPA: MBL fold metallo-hydrolase [Usitatibacter sp.]|nr:MBL fold metallo-hydrolase [Usitatibacter sp.]